MIRYILKRLLQIIPVLLCVAAVIFTIMYFAPGDPVYIILGENITPESYAAKAAELGLDKPFFEQLLIFLKNIFLRLDFGTHFGRALGGTVVIETVFAIPGIGYYIIQAVGNRDYPIIRGGVTLLALLFCLIVLLVDVLYAFIDPRIKAQYESGGRRRKPAKAKKKEAAANA